MSNTSNRPTMRGMFSAPRSTQGRNFLNENKVSLRSLEKSTTEKLAAKQPVRPKWMPTPMRRSDSEVLESKAVRPPPVSVSRENTRESSMTRNRNKSRSHLQLGVGAPESGQRLEKSFEKRNPVFSDPRKDLVQSTERCKSCGIRRSSTNIGIQTEDITDELYLTNALQKCSFDSASMLDELPNKYANNYGRPSRYENNDDEDLHLPENDLDTEVGSDEEAVLSARSRFSVSSKAGQLQKEKREKAAAKELTGHSLDTEQDRVGHLNSAQKRFDVLIDELNHMPITSQTMRVRSRKAEIEKDLVTVEEEIRIYSKANLCVNSSKSK